MTLRRWLLAAALGAIGILTYINLGRINQAVILLGDANWQALILVVAVQLVSYLTNALFYRSFLSILGYRRKLKELYEIAITINFVNLIFPSAGLSGASFLSRELEGVPVGKSMLTQIFRYVFTAVSFFVVLTVGWLFLFLAGEVDLIIGRITLLILLIIIFGGILIAMYVSDRPKMEQLTKWIVATINLWSGRIRRKRSRLISEEQRKLFLDEFYQGGQILLSKRGRWIRPLIFSLAGNIFEVGTIYVVFMAFGTFLNPGVVVAAYTLANIFSLASLVTGGIGVYEATMVAAFVSLGVPLAVAFPVTIVYRVLNFWIFLPLGFYFYRQRLAE